MSLSLKSTTWGGRWARTGKFAAVLDGNLLKVEQGNGFTGEWGLVDIASIHLLRGLVWSSLIVKPLAGPEITLAGADHSQAHDWLEGFQDAHSLQLAKVAIHAQLRLVRWIDKIVDQLPRKWHSNWLPRMQLKETPPPVVSTGHDYDQIAGHPGIAAAMERHPGILRSWPPLAESALADRIRSLNDAFMAVEVGRPLFDTLESSPLTDEQRQAVVCFDHRLMLVAAAGSGKTATMVAKAAYAIECGIVEPHEILMLAFNSAAADELRERLDKRLAHLPGFEKVVSWTFHKFGLDVIGHSTGEKPRPAPWLEGGADVEKVLLIMQNLSETDIEFRTKLMLLRTVFAKALRKFDAKDLEPDNGTTGYRTLNGEIVKSQEELLIANWLFFHGVEYQYEPPYKHTTATADKTQYHPDFYYPKVDLYHEHFALDQHGNPPRHFTGYAEGVKWKRALHAEKETELFETTSFTLRSGQGLKDLSEALTSRGVKLNPKREEDLAELPLMEKDAVAGILRSLMQHAKSNETSIAHLQSRAIDLDPLRGPLFVDIYDKVLKQWEGEMRQTKTVDFDDMINMAIRYVEEGAYRSPYKLVIADEYQDSSYARARLLRAVAGRPDVFLTTVGDDWQSINKFAGADIGVMRTFVDFFGGGTVKYLSRTFRCPEQICKVSSEFILANPSQLPKQVNTRSTVEGTAIQCFAAKRQNEIPGLVERDVGRIVKKLATHWQGKGMPSIMVLGRYRSDRPDNWGSLQRLCKGVAGIQYSTVHSSKGAEADYVLIVNVIQGKKGFPSEIEDDPILQIAMPLPEAYPFAEERRLFYVALTRAKRGVFIYTVAGRPSVFLTELQQSGAITIQDASGEPLDLSPCPNCGKGLKTLRKGSFNPFFGCSLYPKCDWRENAM